MELVEKCKVEVSDYQERNERGAQDVVLKGRESQSNHQPVDYQRIDSLLKAKKSIKARVETMRKIPNPEAPSP